MTGTPSPEPPSPDPEPEDYRLYMDCYAEDTPLFPQIFTPYAPDNARLYGYTVSEYRHGPHMALLEPTPQVFPPQFLEQGVPRTLPRATRTGTNDYPVTDIPFMPPTIFVIYGPSPGSNIQQRLLLRGPPRSPHLDDLDTLVIQPWELASWLAEGASVRDIVHRTVGDLGASDDYAALMNLRSRLYHSVRRWCARTGWGGLALFPHRERPAAAAAGTPDHRARALAHLTDIHLLLRVHWDYDLASWTMSQPRIVGHEDEQGDRLWYPLPQPQELSPTLAQRYRDHHAAHDDDEEDVELPTLARLAHMMRLAGADLSPLPDSIHFHPDPDPTRPLRDGQNRPLPPGAIRRLTLRDQTGAVLEVEPNEPSETQPETP